MRESPSAISRHPVANWATSTFLAVLTALPLLSFAPLRQAAAQPTIEKGKPVHPCSLSMNPSGLISSNILAKYKALGGSNGFLGKPKGLDVATPDGTGCFQDFEGGSIYWSPQTGAWELHGAILAKWASLGGEQSPLGYPTTDETSTPDGGGQFNHFQKASAKGSIYWTAQTGAWAVQGEIRDKWESLGWERSCLGFPIADAAMDSHHLPGQKFEHGNITANDAKPPDYMCLSLKTNSPLIETSQCAHLEVTSVNVNFCVLTWDNTWMQPCGSTMVCPKATTTYRLYGHGDAGDVSTNQTVAVTPPQPGSGKLIVDLILTQNVPQLTYTVRAHVKGTMIKQHGAAGIKELDYYIDTTQIDGWWPPNYVDIHFEFDNLMPGEWVVELSDVSVNALFQNCGGGMITVPTSIPPMAIQCWDITSSGWRHG